MNATAVGGVVFGLRNLKVERGYRYERVPEAVLELACGPLGQWEDPGDGSVPLLEIVPHHGAPRAYAALPAEYRLPSVQAAGVSTQVDLPVRTRRTIIRPEKSLTIEDVAPDIAKKLQNPAQPAPSPIAEAGGASAIPETDPPVTTSRPSLTSGFEAPSISEMTGAPLSLLTPGSEGSAEEPPVDDDEGEKGEEDNVCIGTKDGEVCSREPRSGMRTCYLHRGQEPDKE